MFFDLHRHDEYSTFDGYGKASELAVIAKDLGYSALGISNHGNTNGLVQHYFACKDNGIKPILGVEAYFQPVFNKEKPRYHLCLYAKNAEGYANINKILFEAEDTKYYNPVVTFDNLARHSEGVICTSACIGGYVSAALQNGKPSQAKKAMQKFVDIFGDDYYIEIQPYKVDNKLSQEKVNRGLMKLADELGIKCILTSDSHYGSKEDFPTYLKMHEIAKHNYNIEATYGERYMPSEKDIRKRFIKMHGNDVTDAISYSKQMCENLQEINEKIEDDILEQLPLELPEYREGRDSYKLLLKQVQSGLKEKGKYTKKYIERCKKELEIIKAHGFADYFLIVADYVKWAKEQGIVVGPGRGSVCNCQVAYAAGITEVDSLKYGLDFRRFLRMDKKKLPDIDLDFETSRRDEVIAYLVDKYKGHAAQICSYGLYKVDNLINDLVKVCGVEDKNEIKDIKALCKKFETEEGLDKESLLKDEMARHYNRKYDEIITHFTKLYKKVRFIGTHAAGVAITSNQLLNYTALRKSKEGKIFASYDLADLDKINVVKFDILGLKTMESIGELRRMTGHTGMQEEWVDDPAINEAFGKGDTDGIFQFEKNTAKDILRSIESDCFEDIIAASSMNRPGPLSLGTPAHYAENKLLAKTGKIIKDKFYEFTKETYGTVVYQEQVQKICVAIGNMSWSDADKVMKLMKNAIASMGELEEINRSKEEMREKFVKGAVENGFDEKEAFDFFTKILVYTFNKGHGAGYSLISVEEMFYKLYYPTEFWYTKIKFAGNDADAFKYILKAIHSGVVVFLPHVNYTAQTTIRTVDGEKVIQLGLDTIKGVGTKTAEFIEEERRKNGFFKSLEDFDARMKAAKGMRCPVHKGVKERMYENGALQFNKKIYINKTIQYNSSMLARR